MAITYRDTLPSGAVGTVKTSALSSAEINTNFATLDIEKATKANPTFSGVVTLPSQSVALADSVLPSVSPSLSLDFANSNQLDPRVTFSRLSTATYYDGKTTAMAEQNLLTYSQLIGGTGWVSARVVTPIVNNGIAPDGTQTASLCVGTTDNGAHYFGQTAATAGNILSFYAKPNGTKTIIRCNPNSTANTASFDLTGVGSVSQNIGCVGSIVSVGSGWYRCVLVAATNVFTSCYFWPENVEGVIVGDGINGFYLWGAQLEQRSQVTAYIPTTTQAITNYIPQLMTAPAGVARFDHDPISGKSLGLLIEESRDNLVINSEDISSVSWSNPIGTTGGSRVQSGWDVGFKIGQVTASVNNGGLRQSIYGLINGQVYTLSFYLASVSPSLILLQGENAGAAYGTNLAVTINPTTGATTAQSGFTSVTSKVFGSGRIYEVTLPAAAGNVSTAIFNLEFKAAANIPFYIGRIQFEQTVGVAAIRAGFTTGTGTIDASNIMLDSGATGAYVGNRLLIGYGASSIAVILSYDANTKIATLATPLGSIPASGTAYTILPATINTSGFATSYIPTTTGSVTRSADQANMTGVNFSSWYNASEWSVYVEADTFSGFLNNTIFSISDLAGGTSNKINIDFGNRTFNYTNGVNNYILTPLASGLVLNTGFKFATSVKPGLVYGAGSGGTIKTSTAMTYMPQNIAILKLYDNTLLNGHIKKLSYYPKALSTTELQALTS
jgi:hypothetical protein